ncbi:MAG: zinc-ribbon domain-containing protein [Spirochaetaceae bacterium]|nr:zinc-ribbon domain-containing protein [Spirochaetaceae bacterium]
MFLELDETEDYNTSMEEEKNCKHCHKPLSIDFQFCPYCGALNLDENHFKISEETDIIEDHENLDRLDVLEACLDVLDTEISQFLATK